MSNNLHKMSWQLSYEWCSTAETERYWLDVQLVLNQDNSTELINLLSLLHIVYSISDLLPLQTIASLLTTAV